MIDLVANSLSAVNSLSPYAYPLVFVAGAASSIGPCVAPRFIAVAGLASKGDGSRARVAVCCFIAGLTATNVSFGVIASLLARAAQLSAYLYAAIAMALVAAGAASLWSDNDKTCNHRVAASTSGAGFLLGSSSALLLSPCCTPLVVGIVAYTSAMGSVLYGSMLLACFSIGHALPLLAVGFGASRFASIWQACGVRKATEVLSGSMMLAVGAYYAVLA
jgi:cytochrome c biogenesis protein CcdA